MSLLALRVAPARFLLWPAMLTALLLVAMGTGFTPVVALAGFAGLCALLAVPMRYTALGVLALALLADNPGERPMQNLWQSPLFMPGRLLYENLRLITGIDALRFSALELLVALLVGIILFRKAMRDPIDDPRALGALPNPMKMAFGGFFGVIVFLELYGLARGGDFKNSLWQIRQLFWLPVLGVVFGHAFKSAGARVAVLRTLMAAAWVRCAMGLYFYLTVCRPAGIQPDYTTTHSDSVLTVVAILTGLAALSERPTIHHALLNLVLQPMLLAGLIVNNRRLAFVSLGVGLLALVVTGPPALRRFLKRSVIVAIPLALLYVAAGWNSSSGVFKPVKMIRSVTSQDDSSSKTRDIENFNLIQTLKARPMLGSGFGHEYHEVVQANRVDQVFAQYLFIAHNSVLWILSIAGWLGFAVIWAVFPTALLISLRVYRQGTTAVDRTTALVTAVAVMCVVVQAWGDMGLQSWMATLVVTSLMGATGSMFTALERAEVTT